MNDSTLNSASGIAEKDRSNARRVVRYVGAALLFALLFLAFPQTANSPHSYSLDNSWVAAYHYFSKTGALAGADYQFTYGPYYFLQTKLFDSDLYFYHFALRAIVALVGAACFTILAGRLESATLKAAMVVILLFVLPQRGPDAPSMLTLTVFTLLLLDSKPSPAPALALYGALCGLLALSKFTLFVASMAGLAAVTATVALRVRGRATALVVPAAFLVTTITLWHIAGQGFANVIPYLRGAIEISQAYVLAMGSEHFGLPVLFSIAVTLLGGACVILDALHRKNFAGLITPAFCLLLMALGWKLAANRAGAGHYRFLFATDAVLVLYLLNGVRFRAHPLRVVLSFVTVVAAVAGLAIVGDDSTKRNPAAVLEKTVLQFMGTARAVTAPVQFKRSLDRRADLLAKLYPLPQIREAVGQETVDMFPASQVYVFLNELNYDPRPVFQGYQAGSPRLLEKNGAHYRDSEGPRFVIFGLSAIDRRFPAMEDSQALLATFTHFDPVLSEAPFILLRRRDEPRALNERMREKRVIGWNEWVELSREEGWRLAAFDVHLNPLGRLRSRAFRTPFYTIEFQLGDGAIESRRLNLGCAGTPFIFDPYLETGLALFGHPDGLPARHIERFRLRPIPGTERYFESEIGVELTTIDPLR